MLEQSIHDWIENFLSTPSAVLNDLPPCPFAKQALLQNRIVVREIKPLPNITIPNYFIAEMENYTYHWPKGKEVVVLGCDPKLITADELEHSVETATERFLEKRGFIALEDHPDCVESVDTLIFNQGDYALVLIQEADKLEKARRILQKQDYYKNWPEEYYKDVVG